MVKVYFLGSESSGTYALEDVKAAGPRNRSIGTQTQKQRDPETDFDPDLRMNERAAP